MFVIGSQVLTGLRDRETLEAVIEEESARQAGSGQSVLNGCFILSSLRSGLTHC